MDPIEGVDEDYEGTGQQPERYVPLRMISSPRAPAAAARAPVAYFYNPDIHDAPNHSDDDMGWDPSDPAFRALHDQIREAEQAAIAVDDAEAGVVPLHNFRPSIHGHHARQQRSMNPPAPAPTHQSETQWARLTRREQTAIRGFLRRIPCAVTHASELGMMRLINRFRSRRSGGAKKRSKTHKRRKH